MRHQRPSEYPTSRQCVHTRQHRITSTSRGRKLNINWHISTIVLRWLVHFSLLILLSSRCVLFHLCKRSGFALPSFGGGRRLGSGEGEMHTRENSERIYGCGRSVHLL